MKRFAKELGVKLPVITRYFKPGYDPSLSTLVKWAAVLECSLSDFVDEGGDAAIQQMRLPVSAHTRTGKAPAIYETNPDGAI
jgi:hypothetical protein